MSYSQEQMEEDPFSIESFEYKVPKEQIDFNKNQQGLFMRHSHALNFCPTESNSALLNKLGNEYKVESEFSKQAFGESQVNTIRWRRNHEGKLESNAKIVRWDDGSLSLMIGDKFFNLTTKDFNGEICTITEKPKDDLSNTTLTDQIVPQIQIQKSATVQKQSLI